MQLEPTGSEREALSAARCHYPRQVHQYLVQCLKCWEVLGQPWAGSRKGLHLEAFTVPKQDQQFSGFMGTGRWCGRSLSWKVEHNTNLSCLNVPGVFFFLFCFFKSKNLMLLTVFLRTCCFSFYSRVNVHGDVLLTEYRNFKWIARCKSLQLHPIIARHKQEQEPSEQSIN